MFKEHAQFNLLQSCKSSAHKPIAIFNYWDSLEDMALSQQLYFSKDSKILTL